MILNLDNLIKLLEDLYYMYVYIYFDVYLGFYLVYDFLLLFIYVVGGIGSIVYSLVDNEFNRYGGYGYLFGDFGFVYGFVMDVFLDCFKKLDN